MPDVESDPLADAYQRGYDDGVEQEQVSLAKLFGAHEDNDHDLLVVVRGYIRGYHLKYADDSRGCIECARPVDRTLPDPIPEGYECMLTEAFCGQALYCRACYDATPGPEDGA